MPHPELIPPMSDRALPSSAGVERDGVAGRRCVPGSGATISYVSGMTVHGLQNSPYPTGLIEAIAACGVCVLPELS
jgi:hypothetical protein